MPTITIGASKFNEVAETKSSTLYSDPSVALTKPSQIAIAQSYTGKPGAKRTATVSVKLIVPTEVNAVTKARINEHIMASFKLSFIPDILGPTKDADIKALLDRLGKLLASADVRTALINGQHNLALTIS